MKPIEALKAVISYVSGLSSQKILNVPGAAINKLSPTARQALQELKSSDIDGSQERHEDIKYYTNEFYEKKEWEKDRLEFDKKILKNHPTADHKKYSE